MCKCQISHLYSFEWPWKDLIMLDKVGGCFKAQPVFIWTLFSLEHFQIKIFHKFSVVKVGIYCATLVWVCTGSENRYAIDFIGYRHVNLKAAVLFCLLNLIKVGPWVNVRLLAFYCKSSDGKSVCTTNQNVLSFKHKVFCQAYCEGRSRPSKAVYG